MHSDLASTILGNIGDGIISVDMSLNIVFANTRACNILMTDRDTMIGSPIGDFMSLVICKDDYSRIPINPFQDVLESGVDQSFSAPMVVDSIKSRVVYIEDNVSAITNESGEVIGAVMVFRDVTDEVDMASLLKIANDRYKVLFNSINTAVAVYSSTNGNDFKFSDFNAAAEQIEGMGRNDVVGRMVQEVFPGVDKLGLLDVLKRVWSTGKAERIPCSLYEDGINRRWRDNYVYKLPAGEVVAVYEDVTAKRDKATRVSASIQKLRDNGTLLRGVFDNASIGLVVINACDHNKIIQVNRAFCDFVGYSRDELVGMTIKDITHPDDWDASSETIHKVASLPSVGSPISLTKRYVTKNKIVKWGMSHMSKVVYDDGRVHHFAQVIDITDKVRAENEKTVLAEVVSQLNASDIKSKTTIQDIMLSIKEFANLDAVAVRLPEHIGKNNELVDYSFYFQSGFGKDFVNSEGHLFCPHVEDNCITQKNGTSELACMCKNVILGKTDSAKSFFTKNGSFWTNNASEIMAMFESGNVECNPRGPCWQSGYKSVAIIPFLSGDTLVGAMLLSAKRERAFDERMILFLEELGKTMGVAFARMQMRSDIDENRQALARANGILSVECDVAKSIASGSGDHLDQTLAVASKKLKARWMSLAVLGDCGIGGIWEDGDYQITGSLGDVFGMSSADIADMMKWASEKQEFVGSREDFPCLLSKMARENGVHCIAIPVVISGSSSVTGVVAMGSKNGRRWSKSECDAMSGLATMICILAKAEKNRHDLSRKIDETIRSMMNPFQSKPGDHRGERQC